MEITDSTAFLNKELKDLMLSPEFMEMAKQNHFNILKDILKFPAYELVKMPQFGYRMLIELMSLLRNNNLGFLLKEGYL